jgi:beta-xylosidase
MDKKLNVIFLIAILFCSLTATAQKASELPLADPFILVENGTYYAYGTHSEDGIEVYTSKDLKTWQLHGLALNKVNTTETRWYWAPEVYKIGNEYYMYYSANEHLYAAKATSPFGPFKQIGGRMMKPVLGDEGCIDSSVFFDTDGSAWLFFVRFNDGNNIWVCRLANDHVTPIASTLRKCINVTQPWENKLGRVCEGPNVIKHKGTYYLTYSGNDFRSQDYAVGYATAKSPQGPWTKYSGNPIVHNVENLVGCGHHSLFRDLKGHLRIVFHAHNSTTEVSPRLLYIGSMRFNHNVLEMTPSPVIRPVLKK